LRPDFKQLIFLFFLFYLPVHTYCQIKNGAIIGRIVDSVNSNIIDYATVTVFKVGKSLPVGGALSDPKGILKLAI